MKICDELTTTTERTNAFIRVFDSICICFFFYQNCLSANLHSRMHSFWYTMPTELIYTCMTHLLTYCTVSVCKTVNTFVNCNTLSKCKFGVFNRLCRPQLHMDIFPFCTWFFSAWKQQQQKWKKLMHNIKWEKHKNRFLVTEICVPFSFILPNNTAVGMKLKYKMRTIRTTKMCIERRHDDNGNENRRPIEFFPFSLCVCVFVSLCVCIRDRLRVCE